MERELNVFSVIERAYITLLEKSNFTKTMFTFIYIL